MKRLEYDPEMYWPTILINEGRPYVLKKLTRQGINNPCDVCDLRDLGRCGNDNCHFTTLCTADDRDESWYFEEDWGIANKSVFDYLNHDCMDSDDELSEEDIAKDFTLKHDL